jgi:hypothetical protein
MLPPPNAEVKNAWNYTSISHTPFWRGTSSSTGTILLLFRTFAFWKEGKSIIWQTAHAQWLKRGHNQFSYLHTHCAIRSATKLYFLKPENIRASISLSWICFKMHTHKVRHFASSGETAATLYVLPNPTTPHPHSHSPTDSCRQSAKRLKQNGVAS